jgi:hypothetical protein
MGHHFPWYIVCLILPAATSPYSPCSEQHATPRACKHDIQPAPVGQEANIADPAGPISAVEMLCENSPVIKYRSDKTMDFHGFWG